MLLKSIFVNLIVTFIKIITLNEHVILTALEIRPLHQSTKEMHIFYRSTFRRQQEKSLIYVLGMLNEAFQRKG